MSNSPNAIIYEEDNALVHTFLEDVRNALTVNDFAEFLIACEKYSNFQIDVSSAIVDIVTILRNERSLILRFREFLPAGYQIQIIENQICVFHPVQHYDYEGSDDDEEEEEEETSSCTNSDTDISSDEECCK